MLSSFECQHRLGYYCSLTMYVSSCNIIVTNTINIYNFYITDCPQVQCIKPYIAKEPDELTLDESDVVNVFKKLEDGKTFIIPYYPSLLSTRV
jgi:hypothetical protein